MDANNIMTVYSFGNNCLVSKNHVKCLDNYDWSTFEDFKHFLNINFEKMKYFDDEGELISVINHEDFITFKLMLNKSFLNDEIVVIVHQGSFDKQQYGNLQNILNLEVEKKSSNSFDDVNSCSSTNNSASWHQTNCDSSSSSSSSLSTPEKVQVSNDSKRNSRTISRYAAVLKKELNYLPGSEVSDGQTIVKKWRIKNVGSKKWKANSIKGVLLPSKYSHWVSCSPINVPVCYADQKVDIAIEISIKGQWNDSMTDSKTEKRSQDISLSWLLFKDCSGTNQSGNFKDNILAQLELSLNIINKSLGNEFQTNESNSSIERSNSASSIERINTEYSLVDLMPDSEDMKTSKTDTVSVKRADSSVIDLELPDCPQADDFIISDFITSESLDLYPIKDDYSLLSIMHGVNFIGQINSLNPEAELGNKQKDLSKECSLKRGTSDDFVSSTKTEISELDTHGEIKSQGEEVSLLSGDDTKVMKEREPQRSDNVIDLTVEKESLTNVNDGNVSMPIFFNETSIPDSNIPKESSLWIVQGNIPVVDDVKLPVVQTSHEDIPSGVVVSGSTNEIDEFILSNGKESLKLTSTSEVHNEETSAFLDSDKEVKYLSAEWNEVSESIEDRIYDGSLKNDEVKNHGRDNDTGIVKPSAPSFDTVPVGFNNVPVPMTTNYPRMLYPTGNVNDAVRLPYQAGCPLPYQASNYPAIIGSGWQPQNMYNVGYRPNGPSNYSPGVPYMNNVRPIYPQLPGISNAPQSGFVYRNPYNPNIRHCQHPNPNIDYNHIGFR